MPFGVQRALLALFVQNVLVDVFENETISVK